MQADIDRFFQSHVSQFCGALAEFQRRLDHHDAPRDEQALAELTRCVTASLDECAQLERRIERDPLLLKSVQARYREAIWPWFGKSWFISRSFSKPRGYPGDYELLESIYDRNPKAQGLGGYLDRYILGSTLGRAVVARLRSVRQFLEAEVCRRGGRASMLNVACGPGREYRGGFLAGDAAHVRITCVDNDTEALDFVRDQVAPQMSAAIDMQFIRYNALRMVSAKSNVQRFGRNDIIYSVGLCDYIPDDYLVPMLRGWRESLSDDGVVYVAFKDSELYDKAVYQWLMDWFFYQRTVDDCRRLFVEAGYAMDAMEVARSDMAVIVNFIGRNTAPVRRFDGAEPIRHSAHLDVPATPLPEALEGSGS